MRITRIDLRARAGAALTALALAAPASALNPAKALGQYGIDNWQTAQGLPQNSVHAILQTRDSYLWLGTQEGLARFDGQRFVVFDRGNTPEMSTSFVRTLFEAADGGLWIGIDGGGLLRRAGGSFTAYPAGGGGLPDEPVTSIAQDREGTLWIGTSGGLTVFRDGRFAPPAGAPLPAYKVAALLVDSRGDVWVGHDAGLSRLAAGRLTTFGSRDGLPSDDVRAIVEDAEGHLWVATPRGAARLTSAGITAYGERDGLPESSITCLHRDRHGALWLGTEAGRLARLRGARFEALSSRDGLEINSTTALLEDREGSLWVGTRGNGLVRLRNSRLVTYSTRQGLPQPKVYTVAGARDGGLWVASIDGGLSRFRDGRFTPVSPTAPLRVVRALREGSAGLWIGARSGLHLYRSGRLTSYADQPGLPPGEVRAIVEDSSGALWVAIERAGVSRLDGGRFVHYSRQDGLPSDSVGALLVASNGDLWIGTQAGLARFRDGRFTTFTTEHGLASNAVHTLFEDRAGTLWAGTLGGVSRWVDGRFLSYRSGDGLFADLVHQILEDGSGDLWMSSNKGIFRVGRADLDDFAAGRLARVRSQAYDESDGMLNRECNSGAPGGWRTDDGRLWFATLNGLVEVDPGSLGVHRPAPPVLIESLVVDNQSLDTARPAVLEPGSRALEFHYAAPSFLDPAGVRFRYRLEGYDARWTEAGNRRVAYYTGIPPGEYRFLVTAANSDGVESPAVAGFEFRLRPRLHQTLAFRAAAILAAAGLAAALYWRRVGRLQAREAELSLRVKEAIAELRVLSGLLPICASCKKIRDDRGYWSQIESYIREHSQAQFSHSICPDCAARLYPEFVGGQGPDRGAVPGTPGAPPGDAT